MPVHSRVLLCGDARQVTWVIRGRCLAATRTAAPSRARPSHWARSRDSQPRRHCAARSSTRVGVPLRPPPPLLLRELLSFGRARCVVLLRGRRVGLHSLLRGTLHYFMCCQLCQTHAALCATSMPGPMCSAHLTLRARAGALVPLLLTALGPDDEALNEVDPTAPRERAVPPEQAAPRDAATTVLVALVSPPVVTAGADGAGRTGSVSAPAGGGAGAVSFAGPSMATAALHAAMNDSAPPCVEVVVVARFVIGDM